MVPFLRPKPPSLCDLGDELRTIERSGIFTNYGPVNTRFETALQDGMFADGGGCVTVCNATIGLMMAIRAVVERADAGGGLQPERPGRRYALMPSFTFAAAAMAADWAGLTPLFCDVDERDWAASADAEEAMISQHGENIAVIVPYATFGTCIDLGRYERLSARTGIPVVIDGAASLGSLDVSGRAFGAGCALPVVFSMHVTKTFSTAEGGVIHSTDPELIRTLRIMGNFGFGIPRSATMPGLNSKLSEIGALLALARLHQFEAVVTHRECLARRYREALPGLGFQEMRGMRCAYQFMPVLLPERFDGSRDLVIAGLMARGIGAAAYFAPHVAEQPFFLARGVAGDLSVTARISRRVLSLPLWDEMTEEVVGTVCDALLAICGMDRAAAPLAADLPPPDPAAGWSGAVRAP